MSDDLNNQEVNERLKIDYQFYRQTLAFLGANAPIGVLCLGTAIENVLKKQGIDRVYDLIRFRDNFPKSKGLVNVESTCLQPALMSSSA